MKTWSLLALLFCLHPVYSREGKASQAFCKSQQERLKSKFSKFVVKNEHKLSYLEENKSLLGIRLAGSGLFSSSTQLITNKLKNRALLKAMSAEERLQLRIWGKVAKSGLNAIAVTVIAEVIFELFRYEKLPAHTQIRNNPTLLLRPEEFVAGDWEICMAYYNYPDQMQKSEEELMKMMQKKLDARYINIQVYHEMKEHPEKIFHYITDTLNPNAAVDNLGHAPVIIPLANINDKERGDSAEKVSASGSDSRKNSNENKVLPE